METRTVCCKLITTRAAFDALKETSERFSDACNYVLKIAIEEKTNNAIKLHKLCYAKVRELFGLSANLAVRAIRRVVACTTQLKGKRKQPKKFSPQSIDYEYPSKQPIFLNFFSRSILSVFQPKGCHVKTNFARKTY